MTTLRQAIETLIEGAEANPLDHVPTVSVADLRAALDEHRYEPEVTVTHRRNEPTHVRIVSDGNVVVDGFIASEVNRRTPVVAQVKVGQVWADNDPRAAGRTLRVDSIDEATGKATATILSVARNVSGKDVGRTTKISLRRFKPTSTGYRLVKDA